jgi:drug/metabolite transporter superfamily protein YnfA
MLARLAADATVVLHAMFVLFVVAGGFLTWRWKKLAWAHVPAAVWGVLIEFMGWICPLTPLENAFRRLAGQEGYTGGFVEHYVIPIIYPQGLTQTAQFVLGLAVLTINIVAYAVLIRRIRRGT